VLIDQETCLNYLGLRCDVCYRVCPVIDRAITLERFHNPRSDRHALLLPTVHSAHCTGCGKCEQACVLPDAAAIKVLPIPLARGSAAEHYRRGWAEREAAGGSLIGEQIELPVRGMEGQAYGDTRLRADAPAAPAGLDSGWKP
jgi:ferredoxin-type protein NapG